MTKIYTFPLKDKNIVTLYQIRRDVFPLSITLKGLHQNFRFDTSPLRYVRISKMQGTEDETDRSLLM